MVFDPRKRERKLPRIGFPTNDKGSNGDIELFLTKQGLAMFGKFNGEWYPFSVAKEPGILMADVFNVINATKEINLKTQGVLRFFGNSNKYSSSFKQSGNTKENIDYILPNSSPGGNKALVSDSNNNLSWNQYVSKLSVTIGQGLVLSEINDANEQNIAGISASTSAKGVVELATGAETITGTDTDRAVTPAGLAAQTTVNSWVHTVSGTISANTSGTDYHYSDFGNNPTDVYVEWKSTTSDPTTVNYRASFSGSFYAPQAGTLKTISVIGWSQGLGYSDSVKCYVYRVSPEDEVVNLTGTLIGTSGAITPGYATRTFYSRTVTSGTFNQYDMLYIYFKKDASGSSQTLKFTVNINGIWTY